MQTTEAAYTDGGMRWQVIAPDGSNSLAWPNSLIGHGANELQDTWTLPASGTYTVTIDPSATATGSVKFRAWSVPNDVALTYAMDSPAKTITTTSSGQNAVLTIAGQAGQRIAIETTGSTYNNVSWSLLDPASAGLAQGGGNGWTDALTLPSAGTYRFVIDPAGLDVGSITVRAWTVGADVDAGTVAFGGTKVAATVATPGRGATARFTAPASPLRERTRL